MKKNELKKVLKEKALEGVKNLSFNRLKFMITFALVAFIATSLAVYAAGADERKAEKLLIIQRKEELQHAADKSAAHIDELMVKQKMLDNSERAKDAIIAQGEFSPLKVETTRTPEISSEHSSGIGKWWSKNTLRMSISYEIRYMIKLENLTPIVTESGLYVELNNDDFYVVTSFAEGESPTVLTVSDDEQGIVPYKFSDKETAALISASNNAVAQEYATNQTLLAEALSQTKAMLTELAESFGSKINFVEKSGVGAASYTKENTDIIVSFDDSDTSEKITTNNK